MFTDTELRFLESRQQGRLATIGPDDAPQIHPVAFVVDSGYGSVDISGVRLRESQKYRNVRRDPRVSMAIIDPENPYRYIEIRGRVVEITEDGADESINKLAKKYLGVDKYPYGKPGVVRVLYKIKPEHTTVMG